MSGAVLPAVRTAPRRLNVLERWPSLCVGLCVVAGITMGLEVVAR